MIKKIITVSFLSLLMFFGITAVRADDNNSGGDSNSNASISCIQNAIDKRDNALISAVDVYASAAKTALQTRRDTLKAAWTITVRKDRRAALKAAWNTFSKSAKDIRKQLNESRKTVWNQFNTDKKNCSINHFDEPQGGQGVDAQL